MAKVDWPLMKKLTNFFDVSDIYRDMIVESVIYRHDQEWSAFAGTINIDEPR